MTTDGPADGVIPIFDSLTHPSLDGSWLFPRHGSGRNSFRDNVEAMHRAGVKWAWAVAMGTSGPYDPDRYVDACAQASVTLLPAAFMRPSDFSSEAHIEDWLCTRKEQGYRGIKLHPRQGDFNFQHPWLATIIRAANQYGLIPLLCSYCYSAAPGKESLTIENLRGLLHAVPDAKLVLLHGGANRLLEMAEITRHFKSVLLDVSWTLCEYVGSSLELDLRYVFDRCRNRVCIGSDAPEYSPILMRERFEWLTRDFSREHREKIAFRNLLAYSGLIEPE